MFTVFNELTEKKIEKLGYEIQNIGLGGRPDFYQGCNWWVFNYRYLRLSIYFDPADIMGFVGRPYYELYDGEDTYRFIATDAEAQTLLDTLNSLKIKHNQQVQEFPEMFL